MREFVRSSSGRIQRKDRDVCRLLGSLVEPRGHELRAGVHDVWVARIRRYVTTLSATNRKPVLPADDTFVVVALNRNRRVILLGAVDIVRPAIVRDDVIELSRRLVVLRAPGLAGVR